MQYTKNGVLSWTHNWKRNGWKTVNGAAVRNKEIWIAIDACKEALGMKNIKLIIKWVKGHAGLAGNEMADRLAVNGMNN